MFKNGHNEFVGPARWELFRMMECEEDFRFIPIIPSIYEGVAESSFFSFSLSQWKINHNWRIIWLSNLALDKSRREPSILGSTCFFCGAQLFLFKQTLPHVLVGWPAYIFVALEFASSQWQNAQLGYPHQKFGGFWWVCAPWISQWSSKKPESNISQQTQYTNLTFLAKWWPLSKTSWAVISDNHWCIIIGRVKNTELVGIFFDPFGSLTGEVPRSSPPWEFGHCSPPLGNLKCWC